MDYPTTGTCILCGKELDYDDEKIIRPDGEVVCDNHTIIEWYYNEDDFNEDD